RAGGARSHAGVALAFDLDEGWFAPHFRRPTTWLRLLHYPPLPDPLPPEPYGAARPPDYGLPPPPRGGRGRRGGGAGAGRRLDPGAAAAGHLRRQRRRHADALVERHPA